MRFATVRYVNEFNARGMDLARKLYRLQLGVGALAIVITLMSAGLVAAQAAVIGVVAAVAPPMYFARRALRSDADATPQDILSTVYKGEIGKLVLAAALFGVGVAFYAQHVINLLLPYIGCVVSYWVGIICLLSTEDRT